MGYRGKLEEQARARELRAQAWTLQEIADHLGVAKSSVSLWVRDVEFDPTSRGSTRTNRLPRGADHPLRRRKLAQIENYNRAGRERLGSLTEREFLVAGLALYAGDGSKGDGAVSFANSNSTMVAFFCRWLRQFFSIEESRLRVRLYLHAGLDLDGARRHWSQVTAIPVSQFGKAYRPVPDATIRHNKHTHGCAHVRYTSACVHREIMGLMRALLDPATAP